MYLDITDIFAAMGRPARYSASVMELGQDAAGITWRAAVEDSAMALAVLDTDEKRAAFREHLASFGAWERAEIDAWPVAELAALLLQLVAGDIRESGLDPAAPDWLDFEAGAQAGQHPGNMFPGEHGRIYYYIGS